MSLNRWGPSCAARFKASNRHTRMVRVTGPLCRHGRQRSGARRHHAVFDVLFWLRCRKSGRALSTSSSAWPTMATSSYDIAHGGCTILHLNVWHLNPHTGPAVATERPARV